MPHSAPEFEEHEEVRQVPTNVVLPVLFREKLRYLASKTRVPQAEFIREAVRDLLSKYQHLFDSEVGEVESEG
ncbi:MAG: ribbon-helix-helix domain-containing protein [Pseudomonadota bacterium]